MKHAVVAMGGGPTRVINRSLFGIVDEAARHGIDVVAARYGIQGVLNNQFLPLKTSAAPLATHKDLPGAMIGSTRHKPSAEDCRKAFEIFRKMDAHYFFYIGGNDTAEATSIVNREAQSANYSLNCFHVPKTVDNDLVENDHTPGYGSAARYVANALIGDDLDVRSLPGIKLNVIMGRKAGWLTAAAALARKEEDDGPHLVYVPERAKSLNDLVEEILAVYQKLGRAVVAISEGLTGPDQADFLSSDFVRKEMCQPPFQPICDMLKALAEVEDACGGAKKDAFGHTQLSGTGVLADLLAMAIKLAATKKLGKAPRCRADTYGYVQRSYAGDISPVDAKEAEAVGRRAVRFAIKGIDGSVAIRAERKAGKYRAWYEMVTLEAVAGKVRLMPPEFLNAQGNYVTPEFLDFCRPLVGKLPR